MLNSVSVTNYLGETLAMDLRRPEKSGFLIYNITGIGPNKASINSTELSTNDGAVFNSARVESRNIVISMLFQEHPTIEDARHLIYKYFPVKKKVHLVFETDKRKCAIDGYVESNEIPIFTQQEGCQISIICPNPYFYSFDTEITKFFSVEGGFEFPFSNESVSSPMIEFGTVLTKVARTIYYTGDAEVGILITIHATGKVVNPSIYNMDTNKAMKLSSARIEAISGSGIKQGDDIIISSVRGNKYIHLLRDGNYINILNALERESEWFELIRGDNIFAYDADSGASNIQVRVENQILFEGV